MGGSVVAIEPEPTNYRYLEKNVKSNDLQNVNCINRALSDSSGTVSFHVPTFTTGKIVSEKDTAANAIKVKATSGDDLVFNGGVTCPDIVKVDVEGHDARVLRGMEKIIDQNKPLFFIEVHTQYANTEVDTFMQERGYKLTSLGYDDRAPSTESFPRRWYKAHHH